MNDAVAYPFLTLSGMAVDVDSWQIALNGGEYTDADDYLADWDASSMVTIRRQLKIHSEAAWNDLGIPENSLAIDIVTHVGTGPGRLPRCIVQTFRKALHLDNHEIQIEIDISGDNLSAVIDLFTEVVIAKVPVSRGDLSPSRVGDRLWNDRRRIRLEGEEPRFPIEIADLESFLRNTTAATTPWYLHWNPGDWSRDFHGAIRLYLNTGCPEVIKRVETQDVYMLQAIMANVMSQICERFVMEPEVDDLLANSEPGTVGAQAASWLMTAWPGHDAMFIRSVLENRPGVFHGAFLALAELKGS